jgi:hypothetical protein
MLQLKVGSKNASQTAPLWLERNTFNFGKKIILHHDSNYFSQYLKVIAAACTRIVCKTSAFRFDWICCPDKGGNLSAFQ